MKQVINISFRNKQLEKIVKKPHITLVYPFSEIDQKELFRHINNIVSTTTKFDLVLKGHQKSAKEYYFYLLIATGKSKIIKLYKKLNLGILNGFKNKMMPKYIPHVSLGNFKTKKEFDQFKREMEKMNLEIKLKINDIFLLTLGKEDKIIRKKKFKLK